MRRIATLVVVAGFALLLVACAETEEAETQLEEAQTELEEAQTELEDISSENDAQYRAKLRKVKLGMTRRQVREIMGERPRDTQS